MKLARNVLRGLPAVSAMLLSIEVAVGGVAGDEVIQYHGTTGEPTDSVWNGVIEQADADGDGSGGVFDPEDSRSYHYFTDVTMPAFGEAAPVNQPAWTDYDNDGWDDLTMGGGVIWRNNGDGTFGQVTGIGLDGVTTSSNCAWADIDNDGDLDYFGVAGKSEPCYLYRNDGDLFTDVSSGLLDHPCPSNGLASGFGDYDCDGLLDIYVGQYGSGASGAPGYPDMLWCNNGNATFSNMSGTAIPADDRTSGGVAWSDYDNDGDIDVYVSVYWYQGGGTPYNMLYRNNGDGTMTNVAGSAGVAGPSPYHTTGSSWGDYDNDGDMDLITGDIHSYAYVYTNNGDGTFAQSQFSGYGEWAVAQWADLNNDGWLDAILGQHYAGYDLEVFQSNGDGTFTDVTVDLSLTGIDNNTYLALADYDHDGDLDLFTGYSVSKLWRNDLGYANHWLEVRLVGIASNATGIGARVTAVAGTLSQIREVAPQTLRGSGQSHVQHFGLGTYDTVDLLEIRWPSGYVTTLTDVAADQMVTVVESSDLFGDFDMDDDVDLLDFSWFQRCFSGSGRSLAPLCQPCDSDVDDDVDLTDYATFESHLSGPEMAPAVRYSWPMNTDPGWPTEGLWAWGQPTGGGGQYGEPDPISGYTGNNVFGYNLDGDYENNLPEQHLTTTAIDCSNLSEVSVRFWRWLGVEKQLYDHAYLRVSNDGGTWETVWENGADTITDDSWSQQEFDISAIADGQPTVYLRWTMGATDSSWQYCGWNIDDVEILGVAE